MDVEEFSRAVIGLSRSDVRRVAAEIEAHRASVADDIDWWEATIAIDRVLKHDGLSRTAAVAASSVSRQVLARAEETGCARAGADAISVARAAGNIVRGLVAGPAAQEPVTHLLRDFAPVLNGDRSRRPSAA